MYLPGFPLIEKEFSAKHSVVQHTLTAFLGGLAVGQLFYGPLSDRIGRKPPLYAGLFIYSLASLGCFFSNGVLQLVLFRFLQGLGACAGMVIGRAVVLDRLGLLGSAKAFSKMMLVMAVAPMVAPLLGGV